MIKTESSPARLAEYPFGPPRPGVVALASGAVRALMQFAIAIEQGTAAIPNGTDHEDVALARYAAQRRFSRAVMGSMSVVELPSEVRVRHVFISSDDDTPTSALTAVDEHGQPVDSARDGDENEAVLAWELERADRDRYATADSYSAAQEEILQAALGFVAGTATEDWQRTEALAVAASRGYYLTDVTI